MVTENPSQQESPDATLFDEITEHFEQTYDGLIPSDEAMKYVTGAYLASLDPADPPPSHVIKKCLLAMVNEIYRRDNSKRASGNKTPLLRHLTPYQVAQCLLRLHHVVAITPSSGSADVDTDMVAIYIPSGPRRGLHTIAETDIRTVARCYYASLTTADTREALAILKEEAPRVHQCQDRDLVPMENGVFNYSASDRDVTIGGKNFHFKAKTLHPFDPSLVFLSKARVRFNPHAQSPVIVHQVDQTEWEVEDWMESLSDDPEVVNLLWEIIGATLRPYVSWGKAAFFYSESGNNGKGTLCELIRNLVGAGSYAVLPLASMGKEFALTQLTRTSAIIVDENDVGTFVDKAANLKTIVTNDVLEVNRKNKDAIAYQFWGFMVQCLNGFPRFKDKTASFYRRQLFVPFTKCFTGTERKYIKDDYLQRADVLEYVAKRVLMDMHYYELSEPPACKAVLAEFKEHNDPVRGWWEEFRSRFAWDLVPFGFCYDLFRAWFADTNPSGQPVSRNQFISDLCSAVFNDPEWYYPGKNDRAKHIQTRSGNLMSTPEPLIAEYDLKKWMDPHARGSANPMKTCRPVLSASYAGLLRIAAASSASTASAGPEEDD